MNWIYSFFSGLGKSSFEDKENNEEDLLNGGGGASPALISTSAISSLSEAIAES